jgi:hypothetical protein
MRRRDQIFFGPISKKLADIQLSKSVYNFEIRYELAELSQKQVVPNNFCHPCIISEGVEVKIC